MKRKIKSDKTCNECGHDPVDHYFEGKDLNLYKNRKRDRKLVKEHCEEHEMLYSNHLCKPIWKKCCGLLDEYIISLKDSNKVE